MADLPMRPGYSPRRWQVEALDAILRAWAEGCTRQLLSVATGSGKGDFLAGLARRSERKGSRVLILVHLEQLVLDLHQRIGLVPGAARPGMVMGGANDLGARIIVASVQSLRQPERLARLGTIDVVVIDEAHHAPAGGYVEVLSAVQAQRERAGCRRPLLSVGLTATPYRSGSGGETEGLGSIYEALVYSYGMIDGIRDGVLVPPRLVRIEMQAAGGEDVASRITDPAVLDVVAREWRDRCQGRRCLAFGVDRAHAAALASTLRAAGARAEAVDGATPWAEQQDIITRFRRGQLDVLASCDLIREGFDAPIADALLLCRPSESPVVGLQMLGRGLRVAGPDKRDCLVLDFTAGRVALDLARDADLSMPTTQAAPSQPPRPLVAGETVAHRHRPELGVGEVVASGTVVRVRWDSGELIHGPIELVRRSREEHREAQLQIIATHGYEVQILPWPIGQGPRPPALGWYRGPPERGREERRDWTTYAAAGGGREAIGIVRPGATGWLPWLVMAGPAEAVTCRRLGDGRPVSNLDEARGLVEAAIRRTAGVRIEDARHQPDAEPLSAATIAALGRVGVSPASRPQTEAEGRLMLRACRARLAVAAHLQTIRDRAVGYVRPRTEVRR